VREGGSRSPQTAEAAVEVLVVAGVFGRARPARTDGKTRQSGTGPRGDRWHRASLAL